MNLFFLENRNLELLTVIIEPWGEEYYLKKGQTIELIQPAHLKGYYHQVIDCDNYIQLYVESEFDYPIIKIDDKYIEPFGYS